MAITDTRIEPNTFGNRTVPRRAGLLGLSIGQSLMLVPIVLIVIDTSARGWITSAVIIALATILGAVLLLVTKKQGRSIYGRLMLRLAQRQKVASKKHVYLSGPPGFTPDGQVRLPGLMAKPQLTESMDSYGNPVRLSRLSSRGHHHYAALPDC